MAKLGIFGTLTTEIINTNLCMNCGACIASCPIDVLYMSAEEKPVIKGPCALCQVCYYACPRIDFPINEIEKHVFNRTRNYEDPNEKVIGVYTAAYSARAADPAVRARGADGGAVTALLMHALDSGFLDCAVTMGYTVTDSKFFLGGGIPLKTVPNVSATHEAVLEASASKYAPGSAITGLGEASAMYPEGKIGVVCLPCEAQGLRKLHTTWMATVKYGGPGMERRHRPVFVIALFCTHIFNYDKLMKEYLMEKQHIDPERLTKINIKKGHLLVYYGEETILDVKLKEVKDCAQDYCNFCEDFTGEYADLSAGFDGSPMGWTTLIVRTEHAKQLVESAIRAGVIEAKPLSEVEPGMESILKVSARKKVRPAPYIRKEALEVPAKI